MATGNQNILYHSITSITSIVVALIGSNLFLQKGVNPDTEKISAKATELQAEVSGLQDQLSQSLTPETLYDLSHEFFKREASLEESKDDLRRLIGLGTGALEDQQHYLYNLYLLKRTLNEKAVRFIDTSSENDTPSTYTAIQKVLRSIGYFPGEVNGNRADAREALIKFQKETNQRDSGYFNENQYGVFGNKTIDAIENYVRINPH